MSQEINAHCLVCGIGYHICRDCEESRLNPWRKATCSKDHFKIRDVYLDYRDGVISKKQAREKLEFVNLTDGSGLNDGYRKFFEEVFAQEVSEEINVVDADKIESPHQFKRKK